MSGEREKKIIFDKFENKNLMNKSKIKKVKKKKLEYDFIKWKK